MLQIILPRYILLPRCYIFVCDYVMRNRNKNAGYFIIKNYTEIRNMKLNIIFLMSYTQAYFLIRNVAKGTCFDQRTDFEPFYQSDCYKDYVSSSAPRENSRLFDIDFDAGIIYRAYDRKCLIFLEDNDEKRFSFEECNGEKTWNNRFDLSGNHIYHIGTGYCYDINAENFIGECNIADTAQYFTFVFSNKINQ
jgi:hypothetical protein